MKRVAEHQLSKTDEIVPEGESEPPHGFKKADESVLAKRTIRAMPKRSLAAMSGSPSSTIAEPPTPPKFGGFSGFVSPSTAFTFTSPLTPAPKSPPPTPLLSFPNPASSASNPPIVSSSASAATKTFASFLGPSTPPPPPPPETTNDTNGTQEGLDAAAFEYYTSLRGLNVSFLSAVTTAVEADPFFDATGLLERYRDLRVNVQKRFDQKTAESSKPMPTTVFGSSLPSNPPPMTSMPVPPPSFSPFGITSTPATTNPPSSASTTENTSLFQKPANFSFTPTAQTQSTSSNLTPPDSPPKLPFTFGSYTFGSSSASSPSTLFGGTTQTSSSTSLFGATSSSTVPNVFGYGSSKSPESKESEKPKPATSSSLGNSNPFGMSVPPSPFGSSGAFGSGAASNASNPFAVFGKPSGSIGNPLGFGFGTPPAKATEDNDGDAASSSRRIPTPLFGATPIHTPSEASTPAAETPDAEATPGEDGDDPARLLPAATIHDAEGEGEEDEETTFSVRTKVFKLVKTGDLPSWVEMGIGILKLKKHKETGARRVLLRNSSTGKITINFRIYAGLNVTQTSRHLSFVGHDNGASTTFRLRLKTDADAADLKNAMDSDIAFIKSTSE